MLKSTWKIVGLLVLLVATVPAMAQPRPHVPPLPALGPAPLLYVRIGGPDGMRWIAYQGSARGREFASPGGLGLRPGYVYRLQITNLPGRPGVSLYPTLEVRGTLQLPPGQRPSDYPAPVLFNEDEIERVMAGGLITKVIYLEDPLRAVPAATRPDEVLETEIRPGQDPVAQAREQGRPVVIVRLGSRSFTAEEMARESVAGTVLLPGDKSMPPAAARPWFPFACLPVYDPILGLKPHTEECLTDGGDAGLAAGLDSAGNLHGLEPSDTVAVYKDIQGRKQLTPSNRVCICVPRFAAIRMDTPLAAYESTLAVLDAQGSQKQNKIQTVQPSLQTQQNERLMGMKGKERVSGTQITLGVGRLLNLQVLHGYDVETGPDDMLGTQELVRLTKEQRTKLTKQMEFAYGFEQPMGTKGFAQVQGGPQVVGRMSGVNILANVQELRDITVNCEEEIQAGGLAKPLTLHKWANVQAAKVGDIVTFYLKYANHGGQPISDVAVSDSLTTRLEYIPGSARADRDAVFTLQDNEAGSLILHWEITGKLMPGQTGLVIFQAKIR